MPNRPQAAAGMRIEPSPWLPCATGTHPGDNLPLITPVIVVSAPLFRSLPLVPKLAVTTLVTVALMTWVVMPRVTRLLR